MMEHYTKAELDQYRSGGMSILRKIACSAHLRECPECAKRLEELKDDDHFLHDLRVSVRIYDILSKESSCRETSK